MRKFDPNRARKPTRARGLIKALERLDSKLGAPTTLMNPQDGVSVSMFAITEELRGCIATSRTLPRYLPSPSGGLANYPLPIPNQTVQVLHGTKDVFAAQIIGRKFKILIFEDGPWVKDVLRAGS